KDVDYVEKRLARRESEPQVPAKITGPIFKAGDKLASGDVVTAIEKLPTKDDFGGALYRVALKDKTGRVTTKTVSGEAMQQVLAQETTKLGQ
ncbi:hypothetical protein U2060_14885, partial [Listeria monocytogenes]|uniref:hypothetical protein n=1 Tax=Listeria monocytogenes TaxID=1639 RepID=UPI002FDC622A